MKNLATIVTLLFVTLGYSQSKKLKSTINNDAKVESFSVVVTVDSAKEIESTFTMEDIQSILEDTKEGEEVSFKIICNGEKMSNGLKSHMSYKVEGNTNDKEGFLKRVEKTRESAINYYKGK